MIRSVIKSDFDIDNVEACENARLHCALDTGLCGSDILLRDSSADDLVDELVALLGVGLDADLDVTVLSAAARLTRILGIALCGFGDGLAVCDLGFTDISLDLELTKKSVNDYLKVKLAMPAMMV